ncbi:MAG: hypothetical protein KDC90_18825, partial [Ignavibacteriae bacterium]|nr:hypothetical protein [Ignavibacteriota bacterium]
IRELNQINGFYPNLKKENFVYSTKNKRNFIFFKCGIEKSSAGKNYFAEDQDHILIYSGFSIDPTSKINAHRAEDILENFDQRKYELEGQTSLIRFNKRSFDLDIITDCLGMEQVYYYHKDNRFIISNSVHLIEKTIGYSQLDLYGASYFLSIGWVASDNTLIKDIKVIKGGEHWFWKSDKQKINKKTYFDLLNNKIDTTQVLKNSNIKLLSKKLSEYLLNIEQNFNLECPLTGGFDSRLVCAFLIHNKLKADYYTAGSTENNDVKIASLIAEKFNLKHTIYEINYDYLFSNWDNLVEKFTLQNNGMASLFQIFNVLTDNESIGERGVRLATYGAEFSRETYNRPFLWRAKIGKEDVYNYLCQRVLVNRNGLLTNDSIKIKKNFMNSFFDTYLDKGVDSRLIPELFYIFERTGRHHANHRGINKNAADIFSLFCTKTYLKEAFSVHPLDKASNPIHYKILKSINKELFHLPNTHGRWPIQNRKMRQIWGNVKPIIKKRLSSTKSKSNSGSNSKPRISAYDHRRILETKLDEIKSVCLDQTNSELWSLIKRDKFENIISRKNKIENIN